jgi:hypothetical protein
MIFNKISLSILFLVFSFFVAKSKTFYVSPKGSGSTFSSESPGSLESVIYSIRSINHNMNADIYVILKDGVYNLSSTFALLSADSGTNGFKIIYKAEHPRQAFLDGGILISGWRKVDNLFVADVQTGMKFRQLYVDGKRGTRSREPNIGYSYQIKSWDLANKAIAINGNEICMWNHLNQVEMVIHKHWNYSHLRIGSFAINNDEAVVIPMQPERDVEFNFIHPKKENSQSYYFENAKEFIDKPGEWYHDNSLKKIYYFPRKEETLASEFVIPVIETLVSLEGADNIEFRDLVFQYSNWTIASDIGFVGGQGGYYRANLNGTMTKFVPQTGAIRVKDCHNVNFLGNLIQKVGAIGIDLVANNTNTKIIGNVFDRIAGNGITVMSDTHGKPCINDSITNNYFIRCAEVYAGSVPIISTYSTNTVIEHNEVVQAPYSGISIGWGWSTNRTTSENTQVKNNYIHDFMYYMEDGGGIYTLSYQPNSVIKGNFVENMVASNFTEMISPVAGIYLDNRSKGFSVSDNVLRNIENINTKRINNHIYISADILLGDNTISGNTTSNQAIEDNAGIESQYQNIKSWVDVPNTPGKGVITKKSDIVD